MGKWVSLHPIKEFKTVSSGTWPEMHRLTHMCTHMHMHTHGAVWRTAWSFGIRNPERLCSLQAQLVTGTSGACAQRRRWGQCQRYHREAPCNMKSPW